MDSYALDLNEPEIIQINLCNNYKINIPNETIPENFRIEIPNINEINDEVTIEDIINTMRSQQTTKEKTKITDFFTKKKVL